MTSTYSAIARWYLHRVYHDVRYLKHLYLQYIPRNMHTVFALLCFVVVIHWLIFPYPSGLLHWHCGNLTIAPVPAKQPWWIWINTSCEFIMNDCITTTKQSTAKPCAYVLGYIVYLTRYWCGKNDTVFSNNISHDRNRRLFYKSTDPDRKVSSNERDGASDHRRVNSLFNILPG